jgi:hypothetical protein
MASYGAVVTSRNDGYGGDLEKKFVHTLTSLINNLDEVYYIDWNSPEDKGSLFEEVREFIPKTGKLHVININPEQAQILTNYSLDVQNCVEVLARNIGIRRLMTDFIISTNSDIVLGSRSNLEEHINQTGIFYTVARTEIEFSQIEQIKDNPTIGNQHQAGSPLGDKDKWSLITCPGDFQAAHRSVWWAIKGFDEDMIMRGYTDSNVQMKADYYSFKQKLVYDVKAYHLAHYPNSGSTGGNTMGWNDPEKSLFNYQGTENSDDWGFANIQFDEEIV